LSVLAAEPVAIIAVCVAAQASLPNSKLVIGPTRAKARKPCKQALEAAMSDERDFVIEHINKRLGCHTMTDIVERLRACHGIQSGDPECCCEEAADEIKRLTAHMRALADTSVDRDTAGIFKGTWQGSERECEQLRAEVERLTSLLRNSEMTVAELLANDGRLREALQRIDGINDTPADFNLEIEEVLRAALERKP
jgi:hypothetical protein